MPPANRSALHTYLDHDAYDAWVDFTAEHGITVTGLAQAIGHQLALANRHGTTVIDLKLAAKDAAAVDHNRRARARTRKSHTNA